MEITIDWYMNKGIGSGKLWIPSSIDLHVEKLFLHYEEKNNIPYVLVCDEDYIEPSLDVVNIKSDAPIHSITGKRYLRTYIRLPTNFRDHLNCTDMIDFLDFKDHFEIYDSKQRQELIENDEDLRQQAYAIFE